MALVAYQGEPGTFSEEAVLRMFPTAATRGYLNLDALLEAVNNESVDYGLLPCENSIHGSIARSYDLLLDHRAVHIVDETTYRIVQCLIGTSESKLDDITSVESHPVALDQCRNFLGNYPKWRVDAGEDTAASVSTIAKAGDRRRAAIGPSLAAERYGAKVILENIQDDEENVTRFFLISRSTKPRRNLGRACLAFHLPHRAGSLHGALAGFARRRLNLRNLVVRPRRARPFEYTFYVELEGNENLDGSILETDLGLEFRLLGRY